jgi:fatty acid-binding protein DegV
VDTAVAKAGSAPVDIAIEHFGADRRIDYILDRLKKRVPNLNQINVVGVSAIIMVHVGPGGIGLTISPAETVPARPRAFEFG